MWPDRPAQFDGRYRPARQTRSTSNSAPSGATQSSVTWIRGGVVAGIGAYDHDGHGGVTEDAVDCRTEETSTDAAATAQSDNEEVAVAQRVEKSGYRAVLDQDAGNRDTAALTSDLNRSSECAISVDFCELARLGRAGVGA